MAFLWNDLAYKIEQVNILQKSFMRSTPGAFLITLYGSMHTMNGAAFFARAISCEHIMFMKSTTGDKNL